MGSEAASGSKHHVVQVSSRLAGRRLRRRDGSFSSTAPHGRSRPTLAPAKRCPKSSCRPQARSSGSIGMAPSRAAPQPQRHHPQHLHLILRPMPAPCRSSPISSPPLPWCPMRKSAAARLRPSAIFSITSRASPDHRSRRCIEPPDHSRAGCQPRGHCRERHWQQRRIRSRRRSFRADRSALDQSGRGHSRTGDAALRIAVDRRRGQRRQQPHSRNIAVQRSAVDPDLRLQRQGAAAFGIESLRQL